MAKEMKTNQDGGGKSSTAAAGELKNNQKTEGAGKYSVKKGSHDHPHGAPKMGYNQSFGAARVSGYSKGAAKVADIMSFGASKYMNHGAADAGHGGPDGHEHAKMITKSRSVSGGGSNSSSSSTSGSSSSSTPLRSREEAFQNRGEQFQNMNREQYGQEIDKYNANKKSNTNSLNSSSQNTSSGGGSSTTTSNTVVSNNSMAESKLGGSILAENRNQLNAFNKAETNIRASNDSITKANEFLNKLPAFKQSEKRYVDAAGKRGGQEAFKTRVKSEDFSTKEAMKIYRSGQPER
jgi:hypothetical protein